MFGLPMLAGLLGGGGAAAGGGGLLAGLGSLLGGGGGGAASSPGPSLLSRMLSNATVSLQGPRFGISTGPSAQTKLMNALQGMKDMQGGSFLDSMLGAPKTLQSQKNPMLNTPTMPSAPGYGGMF